MADKTTELNITPAQRRDVTLKKQKEFKDWLQKKKLEKEVRVMNTMPEALEQKRRAEARLKAFQETERMKKERRAEAAGEYSAPRTMTLKEQKEKQREERRATLPTRNRWEEWRNRVVGNKPADK